MHNKLKIFKSKNFNYLMSILSKKNYHIFLNETAAISFHYAFNILIKKITNLKFPMINTNESNNNDNDDDMAKKDYNLLMNDCCFYMQNQTWIKERRKEREKINRERGALSTSLNSISNVSLWLIPFVKTKH